MHDANRKDDPASWPRLGRALARLGTPRGARAVTVALALAALVSGLLDFTYKKYGALAFEAWPLLQAALGLGGFALLVVLGRGLRAVLGRPLDYYGEAAVDAESWPGDQLDPALERAAGGTGGAGGGASEGDDGRGGAE